MQVNLKQHEIETALKNFISQQGISLAGKLVEISFTAGRKESGISAEMKIEDSEIPGFEASDVIIAAIPTLVVVASNIAEPAQAEEVMPEVQAEDAPVESGEGVKTTSLFG